MGNHDVLVDFARQEKETDGLVCCNLARDIDDFHGHMVSSDSGLAQRIWCRNYGGCVGYLLRGTCQTCVLAGHFHVDFRCGDGF